ncbi:hypothetical protein Tco_0960882 [Tanacetum coccineum]
MKRQSYSNSYLIDIYGWFVYEDNLISRRYPESKKALITAPITVKVLMALADDELAVGKNYPRNGEWIDITMRKINPTQLMIETLFDNTEDYAESNL